jgi:hypothetical protein
MKAPSFLFSAREHTARGKEVVARLRRLADALEEEVGFEVKWQRH